MARERGDGLTARGEKDKSIASGNVRDGTTKKERAQERRGERDGAKKKDGGRSVRMGRRMREGEDSREGRSV